LLDTSTYFAHSIHTDLQNYNTVLSTITARRKMIKWGSCKKAKWLISHSAIAELLVLHLWLQAWQHAQLTFSVDADFGDAELLGRQVSTLNDDVLVLRRGCRALDLDRQANANWEILHRSTDVVRARVDGCTHRRRGSQKSDLKVVQTVHYTAEQLLHARHSAQLHR